MLKNYHGHKDPTPEQALRRVKTGVMREAEIERADQLRPHVPTLEGWNEADEQEIVITWAGMNRGKYPALFWLFHTPNGGSRHPAEAAHLKKMGVKPGVPDLCLPYPVEPWHGLWIEMKSLTGKPTALQKQWIEQLRANGYAAFVCRGAESAINCLLAYLNSGIAKDSKNLKNPEYIW